MAMLPSPKNFSWLVQGVLAGLARPSSRSDIEYLIDQGVRHIITLTESPLTSSIRTDGLDITCTHIPIQDLTPPTLEQVKGFLKVVEQHNSQGEAVAVHCEYGQGRVGTMLACYLVDKKNLSANDAMHEVRKKRPGSIETKGQEKLVAKFAESIRKAEH